MLVVGLRQIQIQIALQAVQTGATSRHTHFNLIIRIFRSRVCIQQMHTVLTLKIKL